MSTILNESRAILVSVWTEGVERELRASIAAQDPENRVIYERVAVAGAERIAEVLCSWIFHHGRTTDNGTDTSVTAG